MDWKRATYLQRKLPRLESTTKLISIWFHFPVRPMGFSGWTVGKNRDYHRAGGGWFHCEHHTQSLQPLKLRTNVIHLECRYWNTLLEDRFLKLSGGWIGVRFKDKFNVRGTLG
jgi:hypothetical protein